MPSQERFRARPMWACLEPCPVSESASFDVDSSRSRKSVVVLVHIVFFPDGPDCRTKRNAWQALFSMPIGAVAAASRSPPHANLWRVPACPLRATVRPGATPNRRLEFELGAWFEGSCGFALVLALSQMREHGLGPFGRADLHPRRDPLDRQGRFAPQPGGNSLKKVLLICSHLQQFSEIISPPNRPLPATR
jgi:hypothetical protein